MKDDGGPAFPVHSNVAIKKGMSVLDVFAAGAMQGQIAGLYSSLEATKDFLQKATHAGRTTAECVARASYDYAEAMLAERKRRGC